jgi:hypothetical protein
MVKNHNIHFIAKNEPFTKKITYFYWFKGKENQLSIKILT